MNDQRVPVKADHVVRVLFSEIDRLRAIEAAARSYLGPHDRHELGATMYCDGECDPLVALRAALQEPTPNEQ